MKQEQSEIKNRISTLDGLRVVAILMVMLYHFYSRFLGTHYHYDIDIPTVFQYGYLGVELFFIISGFVITLTLTKSNSFVEFIKKRFVRLIPAMIICSTITFVFMNLFDHSDLFLKSQSVENLFISFTFINPDILNELFQTNLAYIDGAYWSLWAEITFYLIAGLLFFISKKYLLRNFSILVFFGIAGHFVFISQTGMNVLVPLVGDNIYLGFRTFFKLITFFEDGIWFLLGMVLKNLYDNKSNRFLLFYFVFLFSLQTVLIANLYIIAFSVLTFMVLILFIYKPQLVSFLGSKTISKVGIASYSIYLIHQNVGTVMINKFLQHTAIVNWFVPIIVITIAIFFGVYSYKYLELPFGRLLKNVFFKPN